jgi:hypothetical protein
MIHMKSLVLIILILVDAPAPDPTIRLAAAKAMVTQQAIVYGLTVTSSCVDAMAKDVSMISGEADANGLTLDVATRITNAFITAVFDAYRNLPNWRQKEFSVVDYTLIRANLIGSVKTLHFKSTPDTSTVTVVQTQQVIGQTSTSKKFDVGVTLEFRFEREGYRTVTKTWTVMSQPAEQMIEVVLERN